MHKRIQEWVNSHRRCKASALEAGTWFEDHVCANFTADDYRDHLEEMQAPQSIIDSEDDEIKAEFLLGSMDTAYLHERLCDERDSILEYEKWQRYDAKRKVEREAEKLRAEQAAVELAKKRHAYEIAYFEKLIEGHKARVEKYTRKLEEVRRS